MRGVDYYEIYLADKNNKRKIACDIDFTQLGDVIDTAIESDTDKEEYNKFCEENFRKVMFG